MKKLFSLAFCAVGFCTIDAQNLVIYQKGSTEPLTIPLADIEYMEVKNGGHPEMTELVDIKIKNLGRFSFDVEITKGDDCVKYVVSAQKTAAFSESNFIESAELSLDETAFYRPYEGGIGTADRVFAERELGLNAVECYDTDDRKFVTTTVAVYAIDKDGNSKVYTQEFQVPEATKASTPTSTIEAGNITTENFTVTMSASSDCAKIIYGITSADALSGKAMSADLMTDKAMSQKMPEPYSGAITLEAQNVQRLSPNTTYYAYIIPIASDGKIGQVNYVTVKTKAISADGVGRILTANGVLQSEGQYKSVACPQMTFNAEAQKVRIMWCSETDFSSYKNRLVEVFSKDSNKGISWQEYSVNALPRSFTVYHYGDKYYMYAATVDKDGNVSEAQDVLALMGVASPYTTKAETDVVPEIIFDGIATANIANDDHEIKYSPYDPERVTEVNPYFTIAPGDNLDRVLVMRVDNGSNVKKGVEAILVGYPFYADVDVKCELAYANGTWTLSNDAWGSDCTVTGTTVRFKEKWLSGDKLVFVTIDTNGRPKIHSVYTPGNNAPGSLTPFN